MATASLNISTDFSGHSLRPRVATAANGFSIERILLQALLVIALLSLNQAGTPGNAIFFGILVLMMTKSPEAAFKAMTIGFLGLVANQALVQKTVFWTPARLLLPAVCFIRFSLDLQTLRYSLFKNAYFIALSAFIVVAAVLSVLTQYYVPIALLKLLNFAITSTAILSGVQVIRLRKKDLSEWFVVLICTTVILGFLSIALGISTNMRGSVTIANSFFNGPFYHSNCLGPMAAMMVVYLANVVLFGRYRNRWICVLLSACLLYFMSCTQSRTSFASTLVGLIATFGLTFLLARRGLLQVRMNMSRLSLAGVVVVGLLGIYVLDHTAGGSFAAAVVRFLNKGGQAEAIDFGQVMASRIGVVSQLYANFLASPLIGIGFEVSKSLYFQENATLFSAPIEKGFLPMAVLEETGIIGAFFFVMFLIAIYMFMASSLNLPGIAMLTTFLAVNCGESMFFAMAGHGGFGWLWFAAGMMLGDFCIVRRQPAAAQSLA